MTLADVSAHCCRLANRHDIADWLEIHDPDLISLNCGVAHIIYAAMTEHPATDADSAKIRQLYPIALDRIKQNVFNLH